MKEYKTKEEIQAVAEDLISNLKKQMEEKGVSTIRELFFKRTHALRDPDIICRNCGRIVLVGKCCATPDIVERGELSPEALQQVYALTEQTAQPTNALTELMKRGKK